MSETNDKVNDYVLDRLTNWGTAAEGSVLPPIQRGESRVPFVSAVQVTSRVAQADSTTFTLTWNNVDFDPTLRVDHYNIYYSFGSSNQPVGPFIAQAAPATIIVHSTTPTPITFYVQTVLANGMTSPLFGSPTTGSSTLQNVLDPATIANFSLLATKLNVTNIIVDGLTLTNNSPGAGSITWSACTVYYQGAAYSISSSNTTDQYIYWTVGSTSFSSTTFYTPGPTVFLIATNIAGSADVAWNKLGTGGVSAATLNLPVLLSGPNGSLSINGITFSDQTPTATAISWTSGHVVYQGQTFAIASGNTTDTWIYWQLASPTTFQHTNTYPVLGLDDFVVGINNSNTVLGTQGFFSQVLEMHDRADERTYLIPDALVMYNKENNFVASYARTGTDSAFAPASAVVRLADGTGTGSLGGGQRIILSAADGKIQMGTFEINRSNATVDPNFKNFTKSIDIPSGPQNGIHILIDGAPFSIPYYKQ